MDADCPGIDNIIKKIMANYKGILAHTNKWEGGLVYHKNEGQWTNRGIQWTTFKELAPRLINLASPTVEDLKALTQAQWEKFVEYFWNKATYNNAINDQAAANIMFLALWGSGSYGIRDMQKAIGTTADGIVGPITVQKINANKKASEILYQALDKRYRLLASVNPSVYSKYLKGWLNRLSELKPDKIAAISIGAIAAIGIIYYLATNR